MKFYKTIIALNLTALVVACSYSYQPDEQVGLEIDLHPTQGNSTYIRTTNMRPIITLQAGKKEGVVWLYLLNQKPFEEASQTSFQVLCSSAKLVNNGIAYQPALAVSKPFIGNFSWKIDSCSDKAIIKGQDNLDGIVIKFETHQPLSNKFSIVLPDIDFGNGSMSMQPQKINFSRNIYKESFSIR